ncbi:MAG: OmpA family protein [Archangium sp.]
MAPLRSAALVFLVASGCATTSSNTTPPPRDVSELVELSGDSILVKETIGFRHGESTIEPRSYDLLDAVAKILNGTDSISKLVIEGHTDITGEPSANQPLSVARAQAVKKYLEGRGVAANRLEAVGYGHDRPVDSNETEEGRAKNRRVEFKVSR